MRPSGISRLFLIHYQKTGVSCHPFSENSPGPYSPGRRLRATRAPLPQKNTLDSPKKTILYLIHDSSDREVGHKFGPHRQLAGGAKVPFMRGLMPKKQGHRRPLPPAASHEVQPKAPAESAGAWPAAFHPGPAVAGQALQI